MQTKIRFYELGCYADGANGLEHARAIMAELLDDAPDVEPSQDLLDALDDDMSDDAWEEEEASDLLQASQHTPPLSWWGWNDGDWGLWPILPEDSDLMGYDDWGKLPTPADGDDTEAYVISDHGNVTCVYFDGSEWQEAWAVV